jgi:energy-coupling factor transporter ATP-binding protein EcfA2
MKLFVIGPEGSGKTVFVTMLSRYMASRHSDLIFDPADFESSQYVSIAMEELECRRWPRSNPQGELKVLKWRFGRRGQNPHQISMFDYSGQDMRSVLLEDDAEKLQGRPRELRLEVDDSDILIYLMDMDGLIGGGALPETNENAWLLHTFMTRKQWLDKRRIIVVTKADLYAGLIKAAGGNLKKMIADHWPKVYGADEFLNQKDHVECLALTSVEVKTELDDKGRPLRKPRIPLESDGFDELAEEILSGIEQDRLKRGVKETGKMIGVVFEFCRKLVGLGKKNVKTTLVILSLLSYGVYHLATDKYEFTVVTGDRSGAGTDAKVTITLIDSTGTSRSTSFGGGSISGVGTDRFENGSTNVVSERLRPLGAISDLIVSIDDSGKNPAWFLESIAVRNLTTGYAVNFPCNQWLGQDVRNPGEDPWELRLKGY